MIHKLFLPFALIITPLFAFDAYYSYPGDVHQAGGGYEGGDQLLNLGKSIPFQVNLITPEQDKVPITKESLTAILSKVWEDNGLNQKNPGPGKLRFFDLKVLIYPEKDGFVAAVQGRLFEEVDLNRVRLEKEHFYQAITWEQAKLLVTPKDTFESLLTGAVEEIAKSFAMRLEAFRKLESEKN